ncbi:hypothetical protein MHAE_01595 [Mycobacterium haemophilum DSM 44634]|uniref:maleylpyruvate isomerase N-terminal domain-containing protein n=1 Tax=Mycobacterium haemophilum TaxID=29311 RepID=UPI000654FDB3|nr:maleylpyruvate isomerase N-terminal domain-containing protein [Mycobacterium haemophilum]AKN16975.1 hypothetical protein B586_11120 [Mycobacterium haemophilum DSM 44634]MCV7340393.1 hypothetical protein [Mycobacterium haemophilum DSM 44634]
MPDTEVDDEPDGVVLEVQRDRTPRLLPTSDAAAAYRLVYGRVDALLRGRAEIAEFAVPACPAWTVRQTVAHLAGVAHDIISLNLEAVGTDSWTQAQVDRLGGNNIDELLDLWGQTIDPVTARLGLGPKGSECQLVFDALTHEHDIRGALCKPYSRTGDLPFEVTMGFLTTTGDQIIRQTGLPALRLITPTIGSVQLGDPHTAQSHVTLSVSDFEALRAFGGRRSVRQLLALPWQGDPTNLLPVFSNNAIRPPNDDLVE